MAKKNVQFDMNPLLSGPSLAARSKTGSPYRELNIAEIDVDPDQPRREFDTENLAELAASIKQYGVLCPILVKVTEGGTYRIIAGERRFRAAKLIGRETIPAIIDFDTSSSGEREAAEGDILAKQLVENMQRQDLNPLERAVAVGRLRDAAHLSIRDIAVKLGVSKGVVQRSLEILELPPELQAALRDGASETKVLLISTIEDKELRARILGQVNELSREEIYRLINGGEGTEEGTPEGLYHRGTKSKKTKKKGDREILPDDRAIVEEIQRSLGTKVALMRKKGKKGQGRILLDFYTEDDLKEIFRRLSS